LVAHSFALAIVDLGVLPFGLTGGGLAYRRLVVRYFARVDLLVLRKERTNNPLVT